MRLIEENSVIEVAEKFTFTDENERRKYLDFVRYCVQNSKTAYDVENVGGELKIIFEQTVAEILDVTDSEYKIADFNIKPYSNRICNVVKRSGVE